MNGPLGDNLLRFLQCLLSIDAASPKKTKSPVFEAPRSVNGSLAAQFLQIQDIQPIHFTHEKPHHPHPSTRGNPGLQRWFSSKTESLTSVKTELLVTNKCEWTLSSTIPADPEHSANTLHP